MERQVIYNSQNNFEKENKVGVSHCLILKLINLKLSRQCGIGKKTDTQNSETEQKVQKQNPQIQSTGSWQIYKTNQWRREPFQQMGSEQFDIHM